jgi:hypothetical protein
LTPSGRDITERLVRENGKRLRGAFGNLKDDELRVLAGLLNRLRPDDYLPAGSKAIAS